MITHSSVLAWRIPCTEEPDGLYSPWGRKELDTSEHEHMTSLCLTCNQDVLIQIWIFKHK